MKDNKLRRHLTTKHPDYVNKDRNFFQRRETALKRQRLDTSSNPALIATEKATRASYFVSLRIAKKMKPHNIGE